MDSLTEIKLFLLADIIDDILLKNQKDFKFDSKKLYNQIASNVKQLTNKYGKNNDLSEEFDWYKNTIHDKINEIMQSSKTE